jgi:hypothetical protein
MKEPTGFVSVPGIDLSHYFKIIGDFFTGHGWGFWHGAQSFVGLVVGVSIPVSIFFLFAILITVEQIKRIRHIEHKLYMTPPKPSRDPGQLDGVLAERWRKVIEHADSPNENDWKQAIIEADVMLDQLVTNLGYQGESLGEKLKRTTTGDFKTRNQAWEAHLVRNRIAHDGSAFQMNQLEAKRVIGLYRQVFEEFYHISER